MLREITKLTMVFLASVLYLVTATIIPIVTARQSVSATAPTTWVHPGAMISENQLSFIRKKVQNKEQPWMDAYDALIKDDGIANPREPSPVTIVECGSYSIPDVGCRAERNDSIAAYGNALAWAISGSKQYAEQAIKIMDAYSAVIEGHNNSNAPLQSGWVGSVWARTGELIRYTDAGWSDANIERFGAMLKNVYMPLTENGTDHNVANWELGALTMDPP